MVQEFIARMNSCGGLWNLVEVYWTQFQPLFVNESKKLTQNCVQQLFNIEWSPTGSNNKDQEEATIYLWEGWLMEIQEAGTDISFEDLLVFVTGADHIPPLGFPHPCTITFYDQEPGSRRIPYASTCSLTISLPRGVEEEQEFNDLMNTARKGSLGFGKV
ncbi:hypothetical protein Q5P01_000862 [Channa striata]|uniref:HECT domain-containing protein n=1 Tax=Channa striata TaxID=64152 RepID=A0AA88IKC4_CHASR|nr:hypothetical protein Q5P01_000862 [Channa striata]